MADMSIGVVSPIRSVNYVLNPSGEIAGNHSAVSGATISRVTTYQKYGLYSYSVGVTGNGQGLQLTLSSLTNSVHYVTARIRNPGPRLNFTIGSTTREAKLLDRIDNNWAVYGIQFSAAQTSGQTALQITQKGTGSRTFYIDGVQVEPLPYHTTYIDGTQPGCEWSSIVHGSISIRSSDSRAGGQVKDFYKGYGFLVEKIIGAGAITQEINVDNYATLPGGSFNSKKILPRDFTIIGTFYGDSEQAIHDNMQRLEAELLDELPGNQPVVFRFYKATVQKEISAYYKGGLEGDMPIYSDNYEIRDGQVVKHYKFITKASVQLQALDPFWYEVGESAAVLDVNDTATFRLVAGRLRSTGQWSALGPPSASGTYNFVQDIAEDSTYIYVVGSFLNFDNIAAGDNIIRYNKQTGVWSAMSSGSATAGEIICIEIGPDGRVYVGGDFSSIGGVTTDNVAIWNPATSSFAAAGSGLADTVQALKFGADGLLYAGLAGPTIWAATFDGSSWTDISDAVVDSIVDSLELLPNGRIVAGGAFDGKIAEYDGTDWAILGDGLNNAVFDMAIGPDGLLYITGAFTSPSRVGTWNGQEFEGLGDGLNGTGHSINVGPDGVVYVAGAFTEAGGLPIADRLARWTKNSWRQLDIELPGTPTVRAILPGIAVDPVNKARYDLWLGFSTTGTGSFAGVSSTVTSEGTALAFPKIYYTRSGGTAATLQTLRNERTNLELSFDYDLLDGETLVIDLKPSNKTAKSSMFGGSKLNAIQPISDFGLWSLLPGSQSVSSFVSSSGSPTITAYMTWRDAYKSLN